MFKWQRRCVDCKKIIASRNGKSIRCKPCWTTRQRKIIKRMEKAPQWKGGKSKKDGYILIKIPGGNYVLEHRLIMEKFLKRKLKSNEIVHHINHDRSDNRIENLKLYKSNSQHLHIHPTKKKTGIYFRCLVCKKVFYVPNYRSKTVKFCSRFCHYSSR